MPENPGPAVDAQGRSAADPTANVLALVDAAMRRQDDLREAERRHAADLREAESKRVDALRDGDQSAIVALAGQVAATAEAMRVSAAATAAQFASQLAELQRWQYGQQGGREQVTESRGKQGSVGLWVGIGLTVLGVLVTMGGFGVATIVGAIAVANFLSSR